jgi:hypothetical protein
VPRCRALPCLSVLKRVAVAPAPPWKFSPVGSRGALTRRHGARPQVDAYEKQRRALLDDAYSLASQGQDDEEEADMEAVMEDLEKLSRSMAQFKELSQRQQERIERYARPVCVDMWGRSRYRMCACRVFWFWV